MAAVRARNAKPPFEIHNDETIEDDLIEDDNGAGESTDVEEEEEVNEEVYSDSDESDDSVSPTVQADMRKFQDSVKGIKERFRLMKRIGEGTFSTVYKAEDLMYECYDNDWDIEEKENSKWASPPLKKHRSDPMSSMNEHVQRKRRPKYVAIKKIYVTSSPSRILNELELLAVLQGCKSVCPLITAFRHTDQVVAILPYFRHTDFRDYFRDMTIPDMQIYFRSLFTALDAVHTEGILHRDIKPTNFLYEPDKKRGVLVDFGLAEREGTECKPCLCMEASTERRRRLQTSVGIATGPSSGYPKNDTRPSRRANRAGTRGFRAPEVLFKCTKQTTKIDIWSAGVILLTIMSRRFPFFNSADDIEAMIEIATIFGLKRMKQCAYLHGTIFETSVGTIGNAGFTFEKIIMWSVCRSDKSDRPIENSLGPLSSEEKLAVRFLERCLELDPNKRISAEEALQHEFLREEVYTDDDEMHML